MASTSDLDTPQLSYQPAEASFYLSHSMREVRAMDFQAILEEDGGV